MVGALKAYNDKRAQMLALGIDDRLALRVIFKTATGLERSELTGGEELTDEVSRKLDALFESWASGEPLQYIAGRWPFLDFELSVGPGVLIPRPETELIARMAADFLKTRETPAALDLCSGSGCVAIALKRALPECAVRALELSDNALGYLKKNACALAPGIKIICGDVFKYDTALADSSLDCITCNPPYLLPGEYDGNRELEREPREAFVGGEDGLEFYRHIIPSYLHALKSGGRLVLETGSAQTEAVAALLRGAGYREVKTYRDIFGNWRAALGVRP